MRVALAWALGSEKLSAHINRSAGTAVVGHSMGGGATIGTASNATAIEAFDVRVAVAQHPSQCPGCSVKVPTLFMTGDADTVVPPNTVKAQYEFAHGCAPAAHMSSLPFALLLLAF